MDQRDYGDETPQKDDRKVIPSQHIDRRGIEGFPFVISLEDKQFLKKLRIEA